MKKEILMGVVFAFFFAAAAFAVPITQIRYEATDLGSGRWLYNYEVTNISLTPAIEEFTIWFDYGLYETIAVEIPKSGWNELVVQPEPVLADDGYYDALTLDTGIGTGQTVNGFAVSFNWLGVGQLGPQFYEIIDPVTFETIDFGYTVPEPTTLLLLGLGGMILQRKRRQGKKTEYRH